MRNTAGAGDGLLEARLLVSMGCRPHGAEGVGCAFAVNAQYFGEMRGADVREEFSAK